MIDLIGGVLVNNFGNAVTDHRRRNAGAGHGVTEFFGEHHTMQKIAARAPKLFGHANAEKALFARLSPKRLGNGALLQPFIDVRVGLGLKKTPIGVAKDFMFFSEKRLSVLVAHGRASFVMIRLIA